MTSIKVRLCSLKNYDRDHGIDIPIPSDYEDLQRYIAISFPNLGAAIIERADGSTVLPANFSFSDGEEVVIRTIARNPSKMITAMGLHHLWEHDSYDLLCEEGRQIYNSSSSSS